MFARLAILFYAFVSYVFFLISFVYAVGFVGNLVVPRSIDIGPSSSLPAAIIADLLLLGLFAIQHSVMARPAFKRWLTRRLPSACERSTYVLVSSVALLLVCWQWRPIANPIWRIDGSMAWVPLVVQGLGWLTVVGSTYMIDHFELFGLRQALTALRKSGTPGPSFKMPLLYRLVRHPIMLGFLLAFWATPVMTAGHLLFAGVNTAYILIGLQLEERDLIAQFGAVYERYRQRVPMLVPRIAPPRHDVETAEDAGRC